MKKSYYFQHDYNPTNDPKIVCLLGNYGGLGYGVFWRIIELLHQEESNKLPLKLYIYEAIAKQMLASAEQIQAIIEDCFKFELFQKDDEFFWSNRVFANIEEQERKRLVKSEAGRIGGINSGIIRSKTKQNEAMLKQNEAKRTKLNKIKENKIKENNNKINIENIKEQISETSSEIIPNLLNDKQKHIQIIGLFVKAKKIEFSSKEELATFITRNVRAARNLKPYEFNKIADTMKYLIDNADFKWTLESVGKYIDEDLDNLNKSKLITNLGNL